ncbi:type II secretion system protein GspD [Roseimaritima ulvae]|uniref:Type II secretion system protein D n=1 Tax=Roseimaritima ulvae TaxID=980254 RepID=A0A5B9QZE4_9BACT|nr:type II and III secretion system protein [Roseimaritima ulvae]QEG43260.1 Type II secretion system protein D precursor [Roseimaritima ulvae]
MSNYWIRAGVMVGLLTLGVGCASLPNAPLEAPAESIEQVDREFFKPPKGSRSGLDRPLAGRGPKDRIVSLGPTIARRATPLVEPAEAEVARRRPKPLPPLAAARPVHQQAMALPPETRFPVAGVTHESPYTPPVTGVEPLPFPTENFSDRKRVSDVYLETDVRQALQSLAEQAGVSVIIDEQVRGQVTAIVEDETFEDALRKLLLPLGYVFKQDERDCYVGLAEPDSALFPYLAERFIYCAEHRTPEVLKAQLPERHLPFVRTMEQGGRIVVEAPRVLADQVLQELQQLDRAVPQVVLEVLVCVYSPEANFRFGFDLQQGVTLNGVDSAALSLDGLGVGGHYGPAGFNTQLNDFQFTSVFLRALEQKGHVKIRAAPRVMAEDGKKAEIHIGRETFFSVQPNLTGVVFRQDIQKVDSGIMLELTPTIRAPYVTVQIERAEVSEDIRSDETQGNAYDQFPVINRRRVATTVHVQDGQTIVIGGLTQRQKVDQINKLPVLGNLPYVGRVFQRIERRDQEAEVAIFISPQIIEQDASHEPRTMDIITDSPMLDGQLGVVGPR